MKKPYSLEKSYELLDDISKVFLKFMDHLMELLQVEQVHMIGIGNSISAGWTAINNNVCPWLEKFKPFVESNNNLGLKIDFKTFSIAGENSNQQIYEFLRQNPTLDDVQKHFSNVFDGWKRVYQGTCLENYVDKDIAMSFYPSGTEHFQDFYNSQVVTITSFFGCTGELLNHLNKITSKTERQLVFEKEILYLQKIIVYVLSLSKNSYMTIGNFPLITRYIPFITSWIQSINRKIQNCTFQHSNTFYFEGIYLDLLNHYQGKLKLDNHPSLEWQYYSLYQYVHFLMQQIPLALMKKESLKDPLVLERKYHSLDYDGLLDSRIKQINL